MLDSSYFCKRQASFSPEKNAQDTGIVTQSLDRTVAKHHNEDFSHHQYFRQLDLPFKTSLKFRAQKKFLLAMCENCRSYPG